MRGRFVASLIESSEQPQTNRFGFCGLGRRRLRQYVIALGRHERLLRKSIRYVRNAKIGAAQVNRIFDIERRATGWSADIAERPSQKAVVLVELLRERITERMCLFELGQRGGADTAAQEQHAGEACGSRYRSWAKKHEGLREYAIRELPIHKI